MTDVTCDTSATQTELTDEHEPALQWLEEQFPGWSFEVTHASSWMDEELKPIWIARQEGHHPQAELSAAKLHTRLSEYLEREDQRQAMSN